MDLARALVAPRVRRALGTRMGKTYISSPIARFCILMRFSFRSVTSRKSKACTEKHRGLETSLRPSLGLGTRMKKDPKKDPGYEVLVIPGAISFPEPAIIGKETKALG